MSPKGSSPQKADHLTERASIRVRSLAFAHLDAVLACPNPLVASLPSSDTKIYRECRDGSKEIAGASLTKELSTAN